jgi:hypothetical protein
MICQLFIYHEGNGFATLMFKETIVFYNSK